jgi:hypothetical protein
MRKTIEKSVGEKRDISLLQARVHVSLGGTVNMGDYNSQRYDFGVSADVAAIDEATVQAEFVRLLKLCAAEVNRHNKRLRVARGDAE